MGISGGGGVPTADFARKHDTILRYSKTEKVTFNVDDVRIPYSLDSEERLQYTARAFRGARTYDSYVPNPEGKHPEDWWVMQPIMPSSKERVGYPTQKPLALYERIIKASSRSGDMVLDPFCGCATTPVAAERLGREWVGMDIWAGAHQIILDRLAKEGLAVRGRRRQQLLTFGDITYSTTPPDRTDGGDDGPAVPDLILRPQRVKERWERLSHAEMRDILAEAQSNDGEVVCVGCGIGLPARYLELDHITPRKDGGENVITNRILLCGPCNRSKRENLTLSGLVRFNRREGFEVRRDMAALAASKARDAAQRCREEMR